MSLQKTCEVGNHPFTLEDEDIAAYRKFGFEPLNICFPHQHQWRLNFRNDRFLYKRKCDLTGVNIISMYPPDSPYKVYEREAWFSDKWDTLSYGRDFDFNRPFFDQFAELQKDVPRSSLANVNSVNSDFCNMCVNNKNCYLIFGGDYNEDCMFGSLPMYCKNCFDCDWTTRCELCYFCAYSENCYNCRFAFNSKNCSDCAFVEDCMGCNDCIMSFNLRNKSYYIENKSYPKEEYLAKKQEFFSGSFSKQQSFWGTFLNLRQKRPVKYARNINIENSSGDLIFNAKNCRNCFECTGCEDCNNSYTIFGAKDCFNSDYIGHGCALNLNNIACAVSYRAWFSYWTISSSDIEYCHMSNFSKNLFGCISTKHNQYCIFNKQYSKESFDKLRMTIIEHMKKTGEWGMYFPKKLSPFAYNKSTTSFFFPKTKEQALAEGFYWQDDDKTTNQKNQTSSLPDDIKDVPDEICNEIIECEVSKNNFFITKQELAFYRNQSLPVPRRHPDTRYRDRLALRNSFVLFDRLCSRCGTNIKTTYDPNRTETVCCEKCYLDIVY